MIFIVPMLLVSNWNFNKIISLDVLALVMVLTVLIIIFLLKVLITTYKPND